MTTLEERAHDLQRVEHLMRMKQAQLDQNRKDIQNLRRKEGFLRVELTDLDNLKYRLLSGKNV